MRFLYTIKSFFIISLLWGCGGGSVDSRDAPIPEPTATPENAIGVRADFTPNNFLTFLDEREGLGAGAYQIVVATANENAIGTFSLQLNFDDGNTQDLNGVWDVNVAGGGRPEPSHPGNPRFSFDLEEAGGLQATVQSEQDAVLFLVRGGQLIERADANGDTDTETLDFATSQINSREFADAYYATVDPLDMRTTLEDWQQVNRFQTTPPEQIINAVFRDALDLGYGRDMYALEHDCGIAIYEDNYVVQLEPGDASTYGPINLDAAIERDRRFLEVSNAVEFGPPGGEISGLCSDRSKWVVSYYTFAPPENLLDEDGGPCPTGAQCRLKEVDFDGRGNKFMPGVCVVCHGGTLQPPADGDTDFFGGTDLDFASAAAHVSIKSSSFNLLNPSSLEFSERPGFTFEEQRDNIVAVNGLVSQVYASQATRTDSVTDQGNWSPAFAQEVLGGLMEAPVQAMSDFVPTGWRASAGAPDGADELYKEVIEPYCLGCHILRGNRVGENGLPNTEGANAVNFSSYEKFLSYAELTKELVFREGNMPLSLISFSRFWEDTDATQLLADTLELDDAFRVTANGAPLMPGRAVPNPGADRELFFPVLPAENSLERTIELDASSSNFSTDFSWRLVTPTENAEILNSNSAVGQLRVTQPGTYQVGLTTANSEFSQSEEAMVELSFTTEMLDDRETVFVAGGDLQSSVTIDQLFDEEGCTACHTNSQGAETGIFPGLPLFLDRGSYIDAADYYQAVLERINLGNPERSLLLTKPLSGPLQHVGSLAGPLIRNQPCDSNDPANCEDQFDAYQFILSWIKAGAPCGGDLDVCGFNRIEEQPPLAPTALSVGDARRNGPGQIATLNWRDNSVNETEFVIQRSTQPDFDAFVEILDGVNDGLNAQQDDTTLEPSTTYYYRVAAVNSIGLSDFSNTESITSLTPPPPSAPTANATLFSDTGIDLNWSEASDGGPVSAFEIDRRLSSASEFSVIQTTSAQSFSFQDRTLLPSAGYVYRVCAIGTSNEQGVVVRACSPETPTITTVDSGAELWTTNSCGNAACHAGNINSGVITAFERISGTVSAAQILQAIIEAPSFMPSNLLPVNREPKVRAICSALSGSGDCDTLPTPAP